MRSFVVFCVVLVNHDILFIHVIHLPTHTHTHICVALGQEITFSGELIQHKDTVLIIYKCPFGREDDLLRPINFSVRPSAGTGIITQMPCYEPLTRYANCGLCMRRECRGRFPRYRLQSKPLLSDPGMHHGTCVTHVPWYMLGSLTRDGGENFPGIPGACATRHFAYLVRGPWHDCPMPGT